VKETRLVVPATVAIVVAGVVVAVPPERGLSVITRLAGSIVPDGKFDPVTEIFVTPGSATLGDAVVIRVIATGAP
jgi:hypothetical protein